MLIKCAVLLIFFAMTASLLSFVYNFKCITVFFFVQIFGCEEKGCFRRSC